MNDYQSEQLEALSIVREHFEILLDSEKECLRKMIADYLSFREETADFLSAEFGQICTRNCYESRVSACCSKDGIVTFFADTVINVLVSSPDKIAALDTALRRENTGFKCVYLGNEGCLWKVKPIVCEMFLCDQAKSEIFGKKSSCEKKWAELDKRKKHYTWPDKPVLFDALEQYFIDAGYNSPLMYLHNSPGLMRVKKKSLEKGTYI